MEVANLYDNGPISPIARIMDNLGIWSENKWLYRKIIYIEPMPYSSPFQVEMVTLSGATTIAANGLITRRIVAVLQMNKEDMLHLRWEPLDDVNGQLFQLGAHARFSPRGGQARVSQSTRMYDPYLATTTFWILGGENKDMQLAVQNPNPVALPQARFVFFGYRYVLENLPNEPAPQKCVYLPAQGR